MNNTRITNRTKDYYIKEGRTYFEKVVTDTGIYSGKLLDIGCGTGHIVSTASRNRFFAVGLEPSTERIQFEGIFIKGIGEHLPFMNNSFDLVTGISLLEHVQDWRLVVKEMFRVLKPDGKICLYIPNFLFPYEHHFKVPFIPLPKRLAKAYLRAIRPLWKKNIIISDESYIETIQYITTLQVKKEFAQMGAQVTDIISRSRSLMKRKIKPILAYLGLWIGSWLLIEKGEPTIEKTMEPQEYYKKWEQPDVIHPFQKTVDPSEWLHNDFQRTHPCRKIVWERIRETSSSALDVGCGTCVDYTEFFKDTDIEWAGMDITPKFIKACREVYHVPNAKVGDARSIPYPDNRFDTVYCKDLLEHLEPDDWKKVVKEMCRVARKEVIIDFFHPPSTEPTRYERGWKGFWSNWYNEEELLSYFLEIGFVLVKIHKGVRSPLKEQTSHSIYIMGKQHKDL